MAFGDRITNAARDVMLMAAQRRAATRPNEQQIDPQLRGYEVNSSSYGFEPGAGNGIPAPGYKRWYDGAYTPTPNMPGAVIKPLSAREWDDEHREVLDAYRRRNGAWYGSDERDYMPNGYIPWTTKPLEGGDWSGTPEEAYRSYIRNRDENGLIPSLRTYDNGARIPNGYEASNSYPLIEPRDRAWYDNSGYHTGKANMDWVPNKRGNYSW